MDLLAVVFVVSLSFVCLLLLVDWVVVVVVVVCLYPSSNFVVLFSQIF